MPGRVRYSEVGVDGRLTLHHLINYFQDCSTFHLEDIGLGVEYFRTHQLAFLFYRGKLKLIAFQKKVKKLKLEHKFMNVKDVLDIVIICYTMKMTMF